jgi:PAS domain S-box-containing protein
MMKRNRGPKDPEDLRKRAEESLKSDPDRPGDKRLEEANSLIHELRVYQIELEMQNEELRLAQNELEISRSRYVDLYDFAPVGYLTLNKQGQIVDLNLTAARQLGIERGRLVNSHFQYFVFLPDKKEFLSHLNAIFDKRKRQITEVKLSPKGGEQFYARLESIYIEGENGVGLCMTNMSDVTPRKKAEDALHESQQMLHSVLNTIPVRVFWKDLDLNYLGCNRPFSLDAGLQSPEEILGRSDFEMAWGEQAQLYRSDDRLVIETGRPKLGYEEHQTTPSGARIWLRTSKVPLRDVKGEIKGVLGTYEDVTVHKQAEEQLREAHHELERRVEERTFALGKANEELRQIPSKLISVQEEERKRLASELHDSIGQTLAAMKFWIEMVLKLRDEGDGSVALNRLEQFVPILQRSIEETRCIYMGLRPSMLDSVGLLATLEWLRQECMKLYPERHIELDAGITEEEIPKNLKVNIFRIAQEALNNIAKHSKAEWADISISKNRGDIELAVSDDGVGMDLDIIMQTSTATSLGLTSMRERAELTGGSFLIESTPDEGTIIRASWPIQPVDQLQKGGVTQ